MCAPAGGAGRDPPKLNDSGRFAPRATWAPGGPLRRLGTV